MRKYVRQLFFFSVLSTGDNNSTQEISKEALSRCGVNYCPEVPEVKSEGDDDAAEEIDANFQTDKTRLYILATVYLVCSVLSGLIVAFFVDPLSRSVQTPPPNLTRR